MQVFIDKANAISLVQSKKLGSEAYDNCMKMLKYHGDLMFHFPKEELKASPELMDWIKIFADNFKGDMKWGLPAFPPRPLKANLYKQMSDVNHLSSVYLIDDEKASAIYNKGILQLSPIGKELEILCNLILTEDGQLNHTLEPAKMTGWQDLAKYQSPLTDIILIDKYIFSSPDVVEYNLYALLKQICTIVHDSKINIVIFTEPDSHIKKSTTNYTPEFDRIRNTIKVEIQRTTGVPANVTFVLSHDLGEHDRTLFTNMKYYVSGDSYNYFDSQCKVITEGRYLQIYSMANRNNYAIGMNFVYDMQKIIDNVKKKNNPDLIKGDAESNFLHFS